MKTIRLLFVFIIHVCFVKTIYSQVTWLNNTRPGPGNFLGWNIGVPGDLQIRNNFANQTINFWTNNIQRMIITDGGTATTNGNIAIGNNLPVGFTPVSRLQSHETTSQDNEVRFTNSATGVGVTDGFAIGTTNVGGLQARLTSYEPGWPMRFRTTDITGTPTNRMTIRGNGQVLIGNIPLAEPNALLNVRGPIFVSTTGTASYPDILH
jgi:hypothetical protein